MERWSVLVLAVFAVAGCNAISGASALVTGEDETVPVPDREDAAPPRSDASPPSREPPPANVDLTDASAIDADADGPPPVLRVFATSTLHNGNLGGLAGADQICTKTAALAGMNGKFVAWLSTSTAGAASVDAIDRLTTDGEWHLVAANGPRVAASKALLVSGTLEHAIDRDENNAVLPAQEDRVWTGTGANGKVQKYDCAQWTSPNTGVGGLVGEGAQRAAGWTALVPEACAQVNRIYCFEQ